MVKRENSWSTVSKEEDRREVAKTAEGVKVKQRKERRKKRKLRENFEGKWGKKRVTPK